MMEGQRARPMNVIHSDQPLDIRPPTIFLCGPTPRTREIASWRPQALELLHELKFAGTILVPERRDWEASFDYLAQVEWEFEGLRRADALLFWIPRDVEHLPGFTTNVEFGRFVDSGRLVYGRPEGRPHNRYLDWLYERVTHQRPFNTLADTVACAIDRATRKK
jgi:hypothetical protein